MKYFVEYRESRIIAIGEHWHKCADGMYRQWFPTLEDAIEFSKEVWNSNVYEVKEDGAWKLVYCGEVF